MMYVQVINYNRGDAGPRGRAGYTFLWVKVHMCGVKQRMMAAKRRLWTEESIRLQLNLSKKAKDSRQTARLYNVPVETLLQFLVTKIHYVNI